MGEEERFVIFVLMEYRKGQKPKQSSRTPGGAGWTNRRLKSRRTPSEEGDLVGHLAITHEEDG